MLISARNSEVTSNSSALSEEQAALLRMEDQLPPVLSVMAGMVDLTGFFMLGNIFTAHITGNLVVASALVVRGGPVNPAQLLAIPVFMIALALVWLIAELSKRKGPSLVRLLLVVQFLLLSAVLVFCVSVKPSSNPHGMRALVAALIAVTAMACQYALLRLALPKAISTARHDRQSYEHRSFDHGRDIARPPADECRRRSIETLALSSVRLSVGMHHCRYGDFHDGRMGLVAASGTRSACGRAAGDVVRQSP
jgi:hypothetical protein